MVVLGAPQDCHVCPSLAHLDRFLLFLGFRFAGIDGIMRRLEIDGPAVAMSIYLAIS